MTHTPSLACMPASTNSASPHAPEDRPIDNEARPRPRPRRRCTGPTTEAEVKHKEEEGFTIGARVRHRTRGAGTVTELNTDDPRHTFYRVGQAWRLHVLDPARYTCWDHIQWCYLVSVQGAIRRLQGLAMCLDNGGWARQITPLATSPACDSFVTFFCQIATLRFVGQACHFLLSA